MQVQFAYQHSCSVAVGSVSSGLIRKETDDRSHYCKYHVHIYTVAEFNNITKNYNVRVKLHICLVFVTNFGKMLMLA